MDFKIISVMFLLINFIIICQMMSSIQGQHENSGFTAQEKQAIAKLRPLVSDILYKDYMQNDWYLMIWLKATLLDVAKTEKMLRKSYKYRKENNIDNIVADKSYDKNLRDLPYKLGGRDRTGRPILMKWFGSWNVRKFVLSGKTKEYNLNFVRAFETATQVARKEWNTTTRIGNRNTPDACMVLEMAGYNLREGGCLACLPRLYEQAHDWDAYYPDITNIYLLNTPRIFDNVLTAIKQILSKRTQSTLIVYGLDKQEWIKEMHKIIEPEQLRLTLQRPKF